MWSLGRVTLLNIFIPHFYVPLQYFAFPRNYFCVPSQRRAPYFEPMQNLTHSIAPEAEAHVYIDTAGLVRETQWNYKHEDP